MTKIIGLANSCKDCPNRDYYSGGVYECLKVAGSRLNADGSIPAWCPLADYAAHPVADAAVAPLSAIQIRDIGAKYENRQTGMLDWIGFAREIERTTRAAPTPTVAADAAAPTSAITMLAGYADGSKSAEIQSAVRETVDWLNARHVARAAARPDERAAWDGDSAESRAAFRAYDAHFPAKLCSGWQVWRDACAWKARAASQATVKGDEPVAYEFQHDETGRMTYVDPGRVEAGFAANNPRWQLIGPVYRHARAAVAQAGAALTDDAQDAARYRWLKENVCTGSIGFRTWWIEAMDMPDELDAEIDKHLRVERDTGPLETGETE